MLTQQHQHHHHFPVYTISSLEHSSQALGSVELRAQLSSDEGSIPPTLDPARTHKSILSLVQAFPLAPRLIQGGQGRHPWCDGLGVSIMGR